jgi:hypothetical protein
MLFLKLSKFRINKIKASVLVILIVASAFVSLSGFFPFASAKSASGSPQPLGPVEPDQNTPEKPAKSASGSPQPLGLTLVVTPANHPLVIGETLGLRADVVVPTHNKSETTHSKVVSDYDASAFTFVWQTEQSSSASSVDSWNLTSTGVNADFQFTKLTAEPLNVTVSVVYGSQGVIALSSIQVVPASQPKTLQVSIVTPLANDPKLSVNQVLDCSANVTALNQFGNETFMVSLSDALFTYTITAHNTTVLSVNGLQSTFEAYQPVTLASSNGILSLAYASASEAEVWVHLQVTGNNQSSLLFNQTAGYTLVVTDPYTSPFLYFNASTATASYIIMADGLGWYRAVNGTDGSISWSSTDASFVTQSAINSLSSGNIFFKKGAYINMSLMMKSLVNLEGESVAYYSGAPALGTTFLSTGNVSCLTFTGQSFITVKNIRLESDGVSNDIGLDLNSSIPNYPSYLTFDHVTVHNFNYNVYTGLTGLFFNNYFVSCHFVSPRAYDFYGVTSYQMTFEKTTFGKAAFTGGNTLAIRDSWFEGIDYTPAEVACGVYQEAGFSVTGTYFQAEVGSASGSVLLYIVDGSHGGTVQNNRFVGVSAGFTYALLINGGAVSYDLILSPNDYGTNTVNSLQYPYWKDNSAIINNIANTTATTWVFNTLLYRTALDVQCTFDLTVGYTWTWVASSATQVTVTVTPLPGVTLPATMHILSANLKCATSAG